MERPKITCLRQKRKADSHKRDYGHVFILGGSRGMTGAAALCANACLRSGAGLVTLGVPASLNIAMEVKLTEVMTCALPETEAGTVSIRAKKEILARIGKSDIVILGPGLSRNSETQRLVRQLVVEAEKMLVLDADALNALAGNLEILKNIAHKCILTPHSGEMSRLIGKGTDYIKKNRITVAKNFANHYNAVVVLKGSGTIVAARYAANKSQIYVNKSGNPGMATAGSGDVLTGIIGGFLCQGLKSFDAARLAVYVHGVAGDLAAKEKGEICLIASDILEKTPEAIKYIN